MIRSSIGGALSVAAYEQLAGKHRPSDAGDMAAEIRRLRREGLRARDIAQALRLDLASVLAALHPQT